MEENLRERAREHGLQPVRCDTCDASGRGPGGRPCPNCAGTGRLWQATSGLTLADAGLMRFLLLQDRSQPPRNRTVCPPESAKLP